MFRCLGKNLKQISGKDATTMYFLQNPCLKSNSYISNTTNQSSFTGDYLINSCGLSPEATISAAKQIQLKTTENADSVLTFFKNHGFTNAHISTFITKCPTLLLSNPGKTLKPQIDFFNDLGISGTTLVKILSSYPSLLLSNPDKTLKPKIVFLNDLGISGTSLVKILSSNPSLLKRSLNNQIIPAFDFLKSFVGTEENIANALKRSTQVLQCNLHKTIIPNISILRDHGVPESWISKLIIANPRVLALKSDQFNEVVLKVKEMGFDPLQSTFVMAVRAMSVLSKSTWERKMEVYRSLGWSDYEILSAFKKQPNCMMTSEKKIREILYFLAKELDWEPSVVSKCPNILLLSLEKRIVPRCSVLKILMSKGLVKNDSSICWILIKTEKDFLERFVIKYQEEIPEVCKAYQCKIGLIGSVSGSESSENFDGINKL